MKKIVIIGPESTGKSTLCSDLALHYGTLWVPEYAREHLLREGTNYKYEDLLLIAQRQLEQEERYVSQNKADFIFIDTDMYVMKVWCEFVFGRCHQWILDRIVERKYDMYLLCNTDLPWTKDELREYPDLDSRQRLFHMYRDILINQNTRWTEITGATTARLEQAIRAAETLLK